MTLNGHYPYTEKVHSTKYHFTIKPFGRDKQMRNTLIPILVAICLFITGVAILNIQLWYSAKAEYLAGARYAANN
ncbi:hypothetical protein ACUOCP_54780, partial [Escherichia sp. R-CC3]